MKRYPDKFLYIFLDDIANNPKLVFEIHSECFPRESRPYGTRDIDNYHKEDVLKDVDAVDKIGFFAVLVVLLESRIKRGRHDAAVLYVQTTHNKISIDLNIHENSPLKEKGRHYNFVPLKPFYPECDMKENIHDHLLSMKVGRLIIQALLE